MDTWPLQEAKTHLSEVIARAHDQGPQTITRHGAQRAVVLSIDEYRSLVSGRPDFTAYLLGGPKTDEFQIDRDPDPGRDLSF